MSHMIQMHFPFEEEVSSDEVRLLREEVASLRESHGKVRRRLFAEIKELKTSYLYLCKRLQELEDR